MSINIIVVIAIAVFSLTLILGFATSGWHYFANLFGGVTKTTGGYDSARIKCDQACISYQNANCPKTGEPYKQMYGTRMQNSDTNGDGEMNDCYSCLGYAASIECDGESMDNVLTACDCAGG